MKILYGVCGEGLGHSSRAEAIILNLERKDHKVLIITYNQAYQALKNFNPIKTKGISLVFKKEKLSLSKTIIKNIKNFLIDIKSFRKIKSRIDKFSPEICISDMEHTVPIISYWYKIPLISIDNQHLLTNTKLAIPKKYKSSYNLAKRVIKACVRKAKAFIILSYIKQKPIIKNTYIVSPIIREEIKKLKPKNKNYILVYITKENPALINHLKNIKENFIIYSSFITKEKQEGNLKFKKPSKNFINDLANCKAIIASAGFSLISEAIYLKKPYFAIPLKGQFEQTLNAIFLKKSGLGSYSENPTKTQIREFLYNLDKYKSKLKSYKINPNEAFHILDKILSDSSKHLKNT